MAVALWLVLGRVADVETPTSTSAPPSSAAATSPDLAARVFRPSATTDPASTSRSPAPEATAPPMTAEAVESGADLFVRSGCVLCHGVRAQGVIGPRIAQTVLSFDLVLRQVRTPRNHYMPGFRPDQLADAEVAAIYAFLQSLSVSRE